MDNKYKTGQQMNTTLGDKPIKLMMFVKSQGTDKPVRVLLPSVALNNDPEEAWENSQRNLTFEFAVIHNILLNTNGIRYELTD